MEGILKKTIKERALKPVTLIKKKAASL